MLSRKAYRELHDALRSRDDVARCAAESSGTISYDTAVSVYAQKYQVVTRKTHSRHRRCADTYYQRWRRGMALVDLSESINLAATLLARFVLREALRVEQPGASDTSVKGVISRMIQDPRSVPRLVPGRSTNDTPARHTAEELARLARDVQACIEQDDQYSPLVERARHAIGLEYEYVLRECVRNLGVPFLTEDAMREQGYPKTPDIKLQAPVIVHGHVVNWIESKASFCDDYCYKMQLEQFWGYRNRYGPGLVIYWFGFIEELNCHQEQGLLLMHRFPSNVVLPGCDAAAGLSCVQEHEAERVCTS